MKSVDKIIAGINKQVKELQVLAKQLNSKKDETNQKVGVLIKEAAEYENEANRATLIADNFLSLIGEKPQETTLTPQSDSA